MKLTSHGSWKYNLHGIGGVHHVPHPCTYAGDHGDNCDAYLKNFNDVIDLNIGDNLAGFWAEPIQGSVNLSLRMFNHFQASGDQTCTRKVTLKVSMKKFAHWEASVSPMKFKLVLVDVERTTGDMKRTMLSQTWSSWPRESAMASRWQLLLRPRKSHLTCLRYDLR